MMYHIAIQDDSIDTVISHIDIDIQDVHIDIVDDHIDILDSTISHIPYRYPYRYLIDNRYPISISDHILSLCIQGQYLDGTMSIEVSLPPLPEEFKALAASAPVKRAMANDTGAGAYTRPHFGST
jgi:hypothetical protein